MNPPVYSDATKLYSGFVKSVRAKDMLYERSGLAVMNQYDRNADNRTFTFRSNWFVFANGKPAQTCYFPEGQTLVNANNLQRPVFDLRLFSEDDMSGKATVCAGWWDLTANSAHRYWSLIDMQKIPARAWAPAIPGRPCARSSIRVVSPAHRS